MFYPGHQQGIVKLNGPLWENRLIFEKTGLHRIYLKRRNLPFKRFKLQTIESIFVRRVSNSAGFEKIGGLVQIFEN